MLPTKEAFVAVIFALEIQNKDGVIVYGKKGTQGISYATDSQVLQPLWHPLAPTFSQPSTPLSFFIF